MMQRILILLLLLTVQFASAQKIDSDLLRIRQRIDSVKSFSANITLDLDVPFIKMPTKSARVIYTKGKRMEFKSKDFVMLPKRGLDFSLNEVFKYPFITVDRGMEKRGDKQIKIINIIPTDNRSDLALVTLYMDTRAVQMVQSEVNTRKDGSYTLLMTYQSEKNVLPKYVEATFAIERLKIPLNFMGKDTKIDRKKMRSMETKAGKIKMKLAEYDIKM